MKKLAIAAVVVSLAACGTKKDATPATDTTMSNTPTMAPDTSAMAHDTTMMKGDTTMARDTAKTK